MELKIDRQWDATANEVIERSLSPCWIAVDGDVKLLLGIGDRLRADSQEAIDRLRSQGWQVGVLSGDHRSIVDQVGQRLGVPAELTVGGVVPEEKLEVVRDSLTKCPTVVMVGDGVNDSAALAAASVGIAVHGGAEASLVAAPVYLVDDGTFADLKSAGDQSLQPPHDASQLDNFLDVQSCLRHIGVSGLHQSVGGSDFDADQFADCRRAVNDVWCDH